MMVSAASSPSAVVCSAAGDAGGPDQLGGVDLGEAHDGDALGIRGRGIDGVVEDAGGGLGAVDGGRVERLVLAARGDLAEDGAGLEGLAGEHGDGLARDLSVTLGDDELAGVPAFLKHGHRTLLSARSGCGRRRSPRCRSRAAPARPWPAAPGCGWRWPRPRRRGPRAGRGGPGRPASPWRRSPAARSPRPARAQSSCTSAT